MFVWPDAVVVGWGKASRLPRYTSLFNQADQWAWLNELVVAQSYRPENALVAFP